MSKLHSIYAWGVVGVITFSTLFLLVFGRENWQWMMLILSLIPLASGVLFFGAEIPPMEKPEKLSRLQRH
jgi:ATP/ADP translocase